MEGADSGCGKTRGGTTTTPNVNKMTQRTVQPTPPEVLGDESNDYARLGRLLSRGALADLHLTESLSLRDRCIW